MTLKDVLSPSCQAPRRDLVDVTGRSGSEVHEASSRREIYIPPQAGNGKVPRVQEKEEEEPRDVEAEPVKEEIKEREILN
ncbi:hypothetical protein IRJ41_008843 [Triplophysa rosa]|uniref:Uncharacterized protein n=1 Tax=Triplophysa rosa TaxID=992332 RepID=A0A9W7WEQ6_TRIRA|nr:hypothetical protein IRJ41_008843 [Triplophysa rosa]